jgi:hypothetical protein
MLKQTLRFRAALSVGLPLLLATVACTQTSQTTDDGTDNASEGSLPTEVALALSGEGLQVVEAETGSTKPFVFGTEIAPLENAVTQVLGTPEETAYNDECPGGPLTITQWPNGLALNADGDTFVGWSVRPNTESASLTTLAGIGIGSTLSDLEEAYQVEIFGSSLGVEFYAGQLAGLLDSDEPDGMITDMWAGTVCVFR